MNALISPNEQAKYISAWDNYTPIYTIVGERIAQVVAEIFDVAPPLFWFACATTVVADQYAYDPNTQAISIIPPNVPMPSVSNQ